MNFTGFAYRFISNFAFMALVYFSLNFLGDVQQRTIIAGLVLSVAAMRGVSALHTFYFYKCIARLELETRRLGGMSQEGPAAVALRKTIVGDVVDLRQAGEMKTYIDLLFLSLIVVLCLAKLITP